MGKGSNISVVIAVYNGEKFIRKAIKSALNQTINPTEIIVIDDASTDRTREAVESVRDRRVLYFRNEINQERAYTRNRGVEMAQGEFIFFLDHDDEWKEDYIENSLKYLEEGYEVVYSIPREFINENSEVIRISRKPIPKSSGEIIFSSLIGYPSATSLRRESFIKYRSEYIPREDWELFIRYFIQRKKIKILDNRKVMIREHGERTSNNPKFMHSTLKLYEDYKEKIPLKYTPFFTLHTALICLRFGNLPFGWRLLFKSILMKPSLMRNSRNIVNILKWGFRVDRFANLKR